MALVLTNASHKRLVCFCETRSKLFPSRERTTQKATVLYSLRRNIAYETTTVQVNDSAYKPESVSVLIPVAVLSRFRKDFIVKELKRACGQRNLSYVEQMRLLDLLPLATFMQVTNFLELSRFCKHQYQYSPQAAKLQEKCRVFRAAEN